MYFPFSVYATKTYLLVYGLGADTFFLIAFVAVTDIKAKVPKVSLWFMVHSNLGQESLQFVQVN